MTLTAEEILALPAGPEMDAVVEAHVFGRTVGRLEFVPPTEGEDDGDYDCYRNTATGERMSGLIYGPLQRSNRPMVGRSPVPAYSTEVGPAWAVVTRLVAGGLNVDVSYHRNYHPGGKWRCWWQPGYANGGWADGATACEAVCRAALLAGLDAARAG